MPVHLREEAKLIIAPTALSSTLSIVEMSWATGKGV